MKIPKMVLVIGALVLVLALALGFRFYLKAKVAVAVATERANAAQVEVTAISNQLAQSQAINDEIEAALEDSRRAAAAQQAAFLKAIDKIKAAPPAELVTTGGQVIGSTDIILSADQKTVTMGIETYRKFVLAVKERDDYKLVKEPAWNAREALYIKDITQYKANELLYARRDVLNAAIINDLRSVISHQKTTSTLSKIAWAAVGFGAGVLTDKLTK